MGFSISGLLDIVIEFIILGVIFSLLYWLVSRFVPVGIFRNVAMAILAVVGVVICIEILISLLPGGHGFAISR